MKLTLHLLSLVCLASTLAFATNLSGVLVDSGCFASMVGNVSHDAGHTGTDRGRAVRYCAPKASSKSFAVVQHDGSTVALEPAANPKVLEFLQKAGAKNTYKVHVAGNMSGDVLKVDTIDGSK